MKLHHRAALSALALPAVLLACGGARPPAPVAAARAPAPRTAPPAIPVQAAQPAAPPQTAHAPEHTLSRAEVHDVVAQGLGAHGEYVEKSEDIRPALERAQKKIDEGMCALVNVRTDYRARATTVRFSSRET